MGLNCHIV